MNKIILHIGLHKTGTTFLQNHIFPRLKNTNYFRGWHGLRNITNKNHKNILISDEKFSGDPFNLNYIESFKNNIDNLHMLCPKATVLISVRHPKEWILSLYKQYIHQGGINYPDQFFDLENGHFKIEELSLKTKVKFLEEKFKKVVLIRSDSIKQNHELTKIFNSLELKFDINNNEIITSSKKSNVGIKYQSQLRFLIYFNRFDKKLTKFLNIPSLYANTRFCNLFRKYFPLTPRKIAQNYSNLFSKKKRINIPEFFFQKYSEVIEEDWKWILTKCKYYD